MKSKIILLIIAASTLFTGCERNEVKPQDEEMITTQLGLSIEGISIIDEVLTRADDTQPYYVVSVREYNPNTGLYVDYAEGFFDDPSQMSVSLRKSRKYYFSVALLYDYIEKGYNFFPYVAPKTSADDVTNTFYYDNLRLPKLFTSYNNHGTVFWYRSGGTFQFNGDACFGFLKDYLPTSACTIELKRLTTALKLEISGQIEGTITASFDQSPFSTNRQFSPSINLSEVNELNLEFSSIKMVDNVNGIINDSANCPFSITYTNKDGNKTTTIYDGSSSTFKRGYRKVININLQEDNSPISSTLSLSVENVGMQDETTQTIDATI